MTTKFARFEGKRCQETLLEYSLMLKDGRIWMTLFWQDLFLLRTVNGEALDRQVLMFCKRISMDGWKCFIHFTIIFSDKDTFDQWHNNMPHHWTWYFDQWHTLTPLTFQCFQTLCVLLICHRINAGLSNVSVLVFTFRLQHWELVYILQHSV